MNTQAFQSAIQKAAKHIQTLPIEDRTFTLSVKKRFDGATLLEVYEKSFPHVEKGFWEEKITSGNLLLDEKTATPNTIVRAGQITQHTVEGKAEPKVSFDVKLMYASESYWVIEKPAPLPVHAGGRYENNSLTNLLEIAFPEQSIHLVNRLDANTTGLVLVALDKKTARELGQQFEERSVVKTYLAYVEGIPEQLSFTSTKSISKEKTKAGGRTIADDFDAETRFDVLLTEEDHSLLSVKPGSGRTNQIRIHLADLGFPISGDHGYKNAEYFENNPLTYEEDILFLHAWKLLFLDPDRNSKIEFTSTPGGKWLDLMQRLREIDIH